MKSKTIKTILIDAIIISVNLIGAMFFAPEEIKFMFSNGISNFLGTLGVLWFAVTIGRIFFMMYPIKYSFLTSIFFIINGLIADAIGSVFSFMIILTTLMVIIFNAIKNNTKIISNNDKTQQKKRTKLTIDLDSGELHPMEKD